MSSRTGALRYKNLKTDSPITVGAVTCIKVSFDVYEHHLHADDTFEGNSSGALLVIEHSHKARFVPDDESEGYDYLEGWNALIQDIKEEACCK